MPYADIPEAIWDDLEREYAAGRERRRREFMREHAMKYGQPEAEEGDAEVNADRPSDGGDAVEEVAGPTIN